MTEIRLPVTAQHRETSVYARGKYRSGHEVSLGAVRVEGTSKTDTVVAAARAVQAFVEQYQPPRLLVYGDTIALLVVSPSQDGPVYGYERYHTDGRRSCSSVGGATSMRELEAQARFDLAQSHTDWCDDGSVYAGVAFLMPFTEGASGEEDFYRYAEWQRAARWAQDHGEGDVHLWACEHSRDPQFQVPRRKAA